MVVHIPCCKDSKPRLQELRHSLMPVTATDSDNALLAAHNVTVICYNAYPELLDNQVPQPQRQKFGFLFGYFMMYQLLKFQRMARQPIPPRNLVRVPHLMLPASHSSAIHGTECHVTK
jgi:hypothetical protein